VSHETPTSPKQLIELEQIKTVNHHLRIAADQVTDGIMILEADPVESPGPRIVYVNRALCKMTGLKMEEMLGHSLSLLFDSKKLPDFLLRLPAVADAGRSFHTDAPLYRADGGKDDAVRWTVRAVNDRFGQTLNYTVTLQSVTPSESEKASPVAAKSSSSGLASEQVPADPSQMIEKCRLESLAIVAGGMAHDFNNMLMMMMGCFDLMREDVPEGTRLHKHFIDLENAAKSARGLTHQLLAFARGGNRQPKLTDLCDVVCQATNLATFGSAVRCEVDFSEDVRPAIVDEIQITQVLSNLIINARQAMDNTGIVTVRAEDVEISEDSDADVEPGNYVRIAVRDRGCGIPHEDLKNVFNAFYTTKEEGTGLGLAVTHAIVRAHGGDITIKSQVNVGTEFNVYLPAAEWADSEEVEIAAIAAYPGRDALKPSAGGSLLVVDDQEGVRNVAAALIRSLGYDVDSASSGEEAVRLYLKALHEGEPYGIVLLDMTLPGGMSGEETMCELRRHDPVCRIVASSGYFEDTFLEDLQDRGYLGILPKPYTSEQLSESLHDALTTVVV
jgi:PAS domain S-box-containing protein